MNWFSVKRIWQLVALALAIAAAAVALLAPIFAVTAQQGAGQTEVRATALQVAGPSVFAVVAIPLVLAVLPLLARGRPWVWLSYVSSVALAIYTITGIMSIGLLFLPATIVAVVGAFVQAPDQGSAG